MATAIETDYLVVGAGAAGMAVADALLTHSDAHITVVDRRHAPGGHWIDAYPFVRLHQPSAFYGVCSTPLGHDHIDATGLNAGGARARQRWTPASGCLRRVWRLTVFAGSSRAKAGGSIAGTTNRTLICPIFKRV